jgi:hypothetical protein
MTRNVYECINWSRQEHLVAVSNLAAEAFWTRLGASPPADAKHWDLRGDKVVLECVAQNMPEKDARLFLDSYVAALKLPGWKVLIVRED